MFVFKFLRPSSPPPSPHWAPGQPLLPSSPCLTRLVCRVGCQAKSLPPAAHQLGPEPRGDRLGSLRDWRERREGTQEPSQPFRLEHGKSFSVCSSGSHGKESQAGSQASSRLGWGCPERGALPSAGLVQAQEAQRGSDPMQALPTDSLGPEGRGPQT